MTRSLLLLLMVVGPMLAADPAPEPGANPKADAKKMQGTWAIVTFAGPDKPPPEFKKAKFVFEKDTIQILGGPGKNEPPVKFVLSVKKGQGQIDIQPPREMKKVLGLYKFNKGQLTLTFNRPGKDRPTKFDDPMASSIVLTREAKKKDK